MRGSDYERGQEGYEDRLFRLILIAWNDRIQLPPLRKAGAVVTILSTKQEPAEIRTYLQSMR